MMGTKNCTICTSKPPVRINIYGITKKILNQKLLLNKLDYSKKYIADSFTNIFAKIEHYKPATIFLKTKIAKYARTD